MPGGRQGESRSATVHALANHLQINPSFSRCRRESEEADDGSTRPGPGDGGRLAIGPGRCVVVGRPRQRVGAGGRLPPGAGSSPSWGRAIWSPSATWIRATGRPRWPAGPASATRCCSWRCSPISWRSCCRRSARASPSAPGRDLAQACRDAYPGRSPGRCGSWRRSPSCATDLAEVIGTAIGLNLIFGIPLEIGVLITALDVFLILYLQRLGFRWIEAFIITLLGVIAVCFGMQIVLADPDWGAVLARLRADDRSRHQPGHALSGARHHRRDRDAA